MKDFIMANAKPIYYTALAAIAGTGTVLANALGGWDAALKVLCIVMMIDVVTGAACALIWKKSPKSDEGAYESKHFIKGLFRKCVMLLFVLLGTEIDKMSGTDFVRNGVIIFFIGNDGMSIVENAGLMGLPLPAFIKSAFELLKKKGDKTEAKE